MISRRQIMSTALAGLATGITGCAGRGLGDALVMADNQPEGYPTVAGLRYLADKLAQLTGGELRSKIFPGGQLGAENDTLEITLLGGIDINRVNIVPLNSFAPATLIPTLPFVFDSIAHMRRSMDGVPGRDILAALKPHGLIGLCFYDSGARSFYSTERAIRSPSDMRGLKIRVQNSDLYIDLVKALGGDAVAMPYAEVYQGMMQGVVDGAENNWPSYVSSNHFEVAPFYSLTSHVMAPEVVVMARHTWERLSADHQEAVLGAASESVGIMRREWDARVSESKRLAESAGIEVIEPDQSEFRDAVKNIWRKILLRNPTLQPILDDIQSLR